MFETERRTAISTSELGLYSDRGDRYNRNRHSLVVRKFAIGVMVVVAVVLAAIFLYDFTSASSANSRVGQETKHIYVLQNALKKSTNFSRKFSGSTVSPELKATGSIYLEDRSDGENYRNLLSQDENVDPELRSQNLNNFKLRKRVLKSVEGNVETETAQGKQLFDNHAVVYRVRQRFKHPDYDEDASSEENRPTPFHWDFKTPQPASFKRSKYPQLSQYRYPHSSRNIQDIIKYLTNDADMANRGIKFTGVYVNPKKYDLYPEVGEMMSNSDRSEEEETPYPVALNGDPFYQYKPKHPSDVNLLAPSNVRFSPTGVNRYSPFIDQLYTRPVINYKQPASIESQYDTPNAYSSNVIKRRKPKPFSVMLDIYPITDIMDQNKNSRPRPQDEYEQRRPIQYNRGAKFYAPPPQPITLPVAIPGQQSLTDEEERQQMIFHLNLYPRRKNKMSRHDIIHKSESMAPEERQQFMEKVMSPLETIAKHVAVQETTFDVNENAEVTSLPITRYQETVIDDKVEEDVSLLHENDFSNSNQEDGLEKAIAVPSNHKSTTDDDYASTEKYEIEAQKIIKTTTENVCSDCGTTVITNGMETNGNETVDSSKSVDTVEGFEKFSDGLMATD